MIPLKDNIPTTTFPLVTVALIAANVIAYILSIRHGGSLLNGPAAETAVHYGAIPYEFTHPGHHCELGGAQLICEGQQGVVGHALGQPPTWVTALTSMFLHGSLLHIAGNMLFLWIFGNNVEDAMGRVRFVAFYVIGGLAALALQIAVGPSAVTPTLGASGAIAAVLGGYIVLYPRARVLTLVIIIFFFSVIELPAVAMLALWFAINALLPALGQIGQVGVSSGGVAYFAHVAGFVFGLLLIRAFARRRRAPRVPLF